MAAADVQKPPVPSYERCEPGSVNLPIATFPRTTNQEPKDADGIASQAVAKFNAALEAGNIQGILNLFCTDCYWRDHLGLSWDLHTLKGKHKIRDFLDATTRGLKKLEIQRNNGFQAPHYGPFDGSGDTKGIEFFVKFETETGRGRGLMRLLEESPNHWYIFSLFTTLEEIIGHEEAVGPRRARGVDHGGFEGRLNWYERRQKSMSYADGAQPTVIILGAGQGGLTLAARLKILGIDSLIVDRNQRIGDNWRNRYHQLVLHDPVWYDHMPYIPFPPHWPVFTPKDKLGDWFESYAKSMELNVWMNTSISSSVYDEKEGKWTVTLDHRKPDGTVEVRVFHPSHIVQATGHSGKKNMPNIKGMNEFKGTRLCHSSEFPGAAPEGTGKKAIVVGCCNSGHDISHTYYENGWDVTMVQRSSTCVVSSEAITEIGLKGLYDENSPPVEDADIWLYGTPSAVLKAIQVKVTALQAERDKDILQGLAKAGFKLDRGPDDCGLFIKYFQRGGGYYIDVGASQLIVDGKIKIKQGQEIAEVLEHGLRFADGSELEADEIIFATGYQNMRTEARSIFGDAVANKVGDIWGFDEEGEMRTIWRPSGHPGFWFMGGNLAFCRHFSRIVALQILAREIGMVKDR